MRPNTRYYPRAIAIAAFLVLFAITQYLAWQTHVFAREREAEDIRNELNKTKDHFREILNRSISSAKTISILYKHFGEVEHFDSIASALITLDTSIDLINITDKYVVSHVFPLEGNEMILGKSILEVPMFRKELGIAIENKKVVFMGPYQMTHDRGTAIGARIPIFMGDTLKGIVTVITKMSRILEMFPQFRNNSGRYVYQLSKVNPLTNKTDHFFSGYLPRDKDALSVYMPEGNWTLSVASARGGYGSGSAWVIALLGLLLSAAVAYVVFNRARRTTDLERQVQASTHHLRERVKELTTIYRVNEIMNKRGSIEDIFAKVVTVLPEGWQYPDVCAACIRFDGKLFATANFREMADRQSSQFVLQDGREGSIEVVYLEKMPDEVEGPFLTEERNLINALAEIIQIYFNEKINQDALMHSEQRFRSLVERSLVGVYIIQGNRFVYVNPQIIERSGYSEQELLSHDLLDLVVEEDRPTVIRHITARLEGYESAAQYEIRIKRKDGQILWTEMYGATTMFEGNTALIGTMVNVTDRKNLELERQGIIAKLLQRNKDLEEFNHILSHSVRAPVATILGLSGLLKDMRSEEEKAFTLDGIVTSAKQLDAIIANLNVILNTKDANA